MKTRKIWFKNLPLVFLAAAIALSPSFSAGEIGEGRIIEIRIEYILLVILGIGLDCQFFGFWKRNRKIR